MRNSRRGGGIGLEPVYAADTLYKDSRGNVTITSTSATEITEITVGGVLLQDKGISAAGGLFTVNGENGKTVVTGGNGTVTIDPSGEGIVYERKDANQKVQIDSGYVKASGYVEAPKFSIDNNNFFQKEGNKSQLLVSDSNGRVNIGSGIITATGDVNVGGNLWVGRTARFIDGIETDTINEVTTGAGVTVDGVLLKDNGISAADGKFKVGGEKGEIVVTGGSGTVTIDPAGDGIVYERNADGKTQSIRLDSGYVEASEYVKAPKFYIDDTNFFQKEGDKSQLLVSDSDGRVNIGSGFITATKDVNVGGNLWVGGTSTFKGETEFEKGINTDTIDEATDGAGVTVDGVLLQDKGITAANGEFKVNADGNTTVGGTLGVTGATTLGSTLDVTGKINGATITDNSFNDVTLSNGNVTGGTITGTTVTDGAGASMNAGTVKGKTITDNNGFTATGGNVSAKDVIATGTVRGTTVTDGAGASMNGGKVIAPNGVEVDANNYLNSSGLQTSNIVAGEATIGKIKIEGSKITSTEADGTVGIAGITVNNAGALNNVRFIDGVAVGAVTGNGLQFGGNAVVGATNKPFSSTGYEVDGEGNVKGKSFKVNDANYLDSTGLTAEAATIGGVNKLDNTGIDTSGKLHVGGQATFGDSTGTHTTINGGTITSTDGKDSTTVGPNKIKTKTLEADTIILNDHMQDSAGNKIEIGADGHLNAAGNSFKINTVGQLTNEYSGTDAAGKTTKTIFKTSVDGIEANYTNSVNDNNNHLTIDKDGVALGVTDSTKQKLGGFTANKDNASLSYGANNSIVVDANTIKSDLGSDVSTTLTNNGADQSIISKVTDNATSTIKADSIVNKVGSAKRSMKADEIVDEVAGMTVKTNSDGTLFTNGTTRTLVNGSAITSTKATGDTGVLDGSNLTLMNGTNKTELNAGKVTYTGKAGYSSQHGTQTTIDGGIVTTDTLKVQRIQLGEKIVDERTGETIGSGITLAADGSFTAAGGNFKVAGATGETTVGGDFYAKKNAFVSGNLTVDNEIKANTFKVDENNFLNSNGITAKGGTIGGAVIDATTLTIGNTELDKVEGITTNKLKIGGMTLTGTSLDTGTATFEVNGVQFNQGQVTAQADKGFAAGTSSFKQGSLIVDANNKLETTNGLTTEKATVNGTLDVTDKATFGTAGKQTTIAGDAITTDTLKTNKLILGASGSATVEVDKDGSLKAANGKFEVTADGALKAAGGNFTVKGGNGDDKGAFTNKVGNTTLKTNTTGANMSFEKGDVTSNVSVGDNNANVSAGESSIDVTNDSITSKIGEGASSTIKADSIVNKVRSAKRSMKADEIVDEVAGMTVKTNGDGTLFTNGMTRTLVNGSAITSTKATGNTGVLDGSNLTLTNGTNKTELNAGGATFTGDAGEKGGKQTIINGGTITTDTLNVERINLGEDILDRNGDSHGSNLSMDKQGNFKAAGGNFTVKGGNGDDKGAFTNKVGNTTLKTNTTGANMSFEKGNVTSNVSVGDNNANVSAGAGSIDVTNESITSKVGEGASSTIKADKITDKVGGTTVEIKDGSFYVEGNTGNGMEMNTNTGKTTFTGAAGEKGGKQTIINGGNITTDTLNVERINLGGEIVDKTGATVGGNLSMDAQGNFSAAGGKFKVNGADGAMTNTVGKTSFATSDDGVNSSVTQDDEHKSEFNQGLTSIGGVITNGEIKVAQKLDGETGKLTSEVKDANGSSKLEQSGTGLTYTDSAKPDNATRINSSDVSIGSAKNEKERINLSDLGQIDDLDSELTARGEYNQTAVGGINAEAAIRREEVARLDNRINDVSTRVDKVGAMAAAIASLKSIGYNPQAPSQFSIGLGQYKGQTGVAIGFFHYPNKNFMINVNLSTAGGETMGGIGATWCFGYKSPQKLLEEQREAQAKKELAAAEKK